MYKYILHPTEDPTGPPWRAQVTPPQGTTYDVKYNHSNVSVSLLLQWSVPRTDPGCSNTSRCHLLEFTARSVEGFVCQQIN